MEKYFKIEVRIGYGLKELKTYYQLIDCFYYGDGYIRIENNKIFGAIAIDYIEGTIGDEIVKMGLYTEDGMYDMEIATEDFDLPGVFLMDYTDITINLSVGEVVRDPQKQRRIQECIEEAKKYSFP